MTMRDFGSVVRGVRAMSKPYPADEHKPGWDLSFGFFGFWAHWWTPVWHKGRGPYVSIGLGLIRIARGY